MKSTIIKWIFFSNDDPQILKMHALSKLEAENYGKSLKKQT